ncbi:MAG: DUF3152 domain-containing protein, partial [Actinomycetota bacterium]|nr:DUF3152 domain-containing protein [Actinomycetota bacterium]
VLVPAIVVFLAACSEQRADPVTRREPAPSSPSQMRAGPMPSPSPRSNPSPTKSRDGKEDVVVVRYMLVRKVSDEATADFGRMAEGTLSDPRGWERAGFDLIRRPRARYRVVLAEGEVVDRLCLPYETYGTYSCQNGPVVALNADRWRTATPKWTGTLAGYKRMLVNHEFGHLLGQHHPEVQCPQPGRKAPIMAQQSTELNGCLPNPWPLPHEIKRAARHDLPLAPGYGK